LKINSQIPGKHTARVNEILNSGDDKAMLKLFRDETTYLVLIVRVRNQERREQFELQDKSDEWPNAFAALEKEVSKKGTKE